MKGDISIRVHVEGVGETWLPLSCLPKMLDAEREKAELAPLIEASIGLADDEHTPLELISPEIERKVTEIKSRKALTVRMKMEKLLPCPFCGGRAVAAIVNELHSIYCESCHGQTGEFEQMSEVSEAWNRRPDTSAELEGLLKELVSLEKRFCLDDENSERNAAFLAELEVIRNAIRDLFTRHEGRE